MTKAEMYRVLGIIRANLPGVFLNQTAEDAEFMASEWADLFRNYPAALVTAAARTYVYNTTDRRNFPTPRDILSEAERIKADIHRCSVGETMFELGISGRYPPSVAEYMEREYREEYRLRNGSEFPKRVLPGFSKE